MCAGLRCAGHPMTVLACSQVEKNHESWARAGLAQTRLHTSLTALCLLRTRYLTSLRGHVSAVYQIAWSADSRLLVSGSSDSTLKVWDAKTKKLAIDLPGHADEVRCLVQPRCLREAGMTPPSRDNSLSLILGVCNGLEPGRTEGSKWREG